MEFPSELIFKEVHDIADELEKEIIDKTSVQITIHMDPAEKYEDGNN